MPDHQTIAEFRRANASAIRKICTQFVELYRRIDVLKGDCVAIDGLPCDLPPERPSV